MECPVDVRFVIDTLFAVFSLESVPPNRARARSFNVAKTEHEDEDEHEDDWGRTGDVPTPR